MYEHLGKAVDGLMRGMAVILIVTVPLAIWKVIDIIVWVFQHVQLGIK